MVGIVSGNGLGLWNALSNGMGVAADSHLLGQANGVANVNVATGNLSVQFLDETLSGMGADMGALRTYNSKVDMTGSSLYLDGDLDGWRWAGERRVYLKSGTLNTAGSQLIRLTDDGHEAVFTWDTGTSSYKSTEGDGAHDKIIWVASTSEYVWTEGSSGTVDRYLSTGVLKSTRDSNGSGFDYTFNGYKLTKITDTRTLESLEFTYGTSGNGLGKLERIDTRTGGNVLNMQVYYAYDIYKRLESVTTDLTPNDNAKTDGKVYTTTYTYSDTTTTRFSNIQQSDGTSASFTYDSTGRVKSVSDYSGLTSFTYGTGTTTVTNGAGDVWTYTYDANSQLLKVESSPVNSVKQSISYTYDANGNIQSVTDGRGNQTTYGYDANGNRTSEMDAMGNTITRTFNSTTNKLLTETRYTQPSLTAPSGAEVVRYAYDSANRLRFSISTEGRVIENRYNANGLVAQTIQYGSGFYISSNFAENDLISWIASQDKTKTQLTEYEYDPRGNLQKTTQYAAVNASGVGVLTVAANVIKYVYSAHGQLLQTIAARAAETTLSSMSYDGLGRQTQLVNENGTATTIYQGAQITVTNSATGLSVITSRDSSGRITNVTSNGDNTNRITKYFYDDAGRLRMSEDPIGARNYLFYDVAGRVSAKVNAVGAATVYTYDADGRVVAETNYNNIANTSTWFDGTKVVKNSFKVGLTSADLTPGQPSVISTQVDYPVTVSADNGSAYPNMYVNFKKLDSPATGVLKYVFTFYPAGYPGWKDDYVAEYYAQQPRAIIQGNAGVNKVYTARITVIDVYDKVIGDTGLFTFKGVNGQPQVSAAKMTYQKAGPVVAPADIIVNNAPNSAYKDRVTSYVYDAAGRLKTSTVAGLAETENTYNGKSQLVATKQGAEITQYYYDKDGKQLGVLNAERYLTENIYDAVGRLSKKVRYGGQIGSTSGVFSAIKAAAVAASAALTTSDQTLSSFYYYDNEGRIVGEVNEQGFLTETVYDVSNNTRKTLQYMTAVAPTPADTLDTLKTKAGLSEATINSYDKYGRLDNVKTHDGTISRNVYDTAGRLIRTIQGDSSTDHTEMRATRMQYNAFGEITGTVSGVGENKVTLEGLALTSAITNYGTTVQFDAAGRKIAEFGPAELNKPQTKTLLFYNAKGELTFSVNSLGEVSSTTYNAFGQIDTIRIYSQRISVAGLVGGIETSTLIARVNSIANPQTDKVLIYTYTQFGAVASFRDADPYFTKYTYDTNGNLISSVQDIVYGSSSTQTLYSYDLLRRVKDTTRDYGVIAAKSGVTYDGFGRITDSYDAKNQHTYSVYSDKGNTITITDPMARTRKIQTDAFGRTIKSYDGSGSGLFTAYSYDDANRKLTVTSAEGISVSTVKTRTGETLSVTDGKGGVITYSYTKDGLLDKVIDAKAIQTIDNDYDNSGRLYQSTDANGVVTRYEYDSANRVVKKIVDADGPLKIQTNYAFDGQGRQITVTEGSGSPEQTVTQYDYNRNGKISRIVIDPTGLALTTGFTYDGLGNTTQVSKGTLTNPNQQITLYTFDQLGRKVLEQQDPTGLNIRTQYKYDPQGNLTRVIDANGNSTWFTYNAANQKTRQIDAFGGVTTYNYDKNGFLIQTRQLATPLSAATISSWASVDVVSNTFTLPTDDPNNDRRTYTVYDNDNRLKFTISAKSATEWVVSENVYDLNNNVVELRAYDKTLTDTTIVAMSTQAANERSSISVADVSAALSSLGYTPSNMGLARVTRYEYDSNNRQVKTTLPGYYSATSGQVSATAIYADSFRRTIEVTYDKVGNAIRNSIATGPNTNDRINQYKTYDAAGREIHEIDGLGYVTQKVYDSLGNMTALRRSSAVNSTQANASINGISYWTPAAIGNVSGREIVYKYDAAGRQIKVTQPSTGTTNYVSPDASSPTNSTAPIFYSGQAITEFFYDALGNRIKQSSTVDSSSARVETYSYFDKAGRQTWSVDVLGYGTFTEYDALGNVKRTTEYYNKGTGTLNSTATPPNYTTSTLDRVTEFTYDLTGRVKTTSRKLNNVLTLVNTKNYNTFGEIKESIDAQSNMTQIEYDRLGKMSKLTEPSRLVASTGVDVFVGQVNATPITVFEYDAFGQSTKQTRSTNAGLGATVSVSHVYDLAGNEIQTIDGRNNSVFMEYDVTGRITKQKQTVSVSNATSDINYTHTIERRFEYDAIGRQTATLDVFNGQKSGQVNIYNSYGEVTEERKVWGTNTASTSSLLASATNNVAVNSYAYDTAGRVQYKLGADGYTYFFYDLLGSVTRTEQRGSSQTYNTDTRVTENYYDKAGHLLVQRSPQFNASNGWQVETTALFTPIVEQTFDRWGNVLTRTDPARAVNADSSIKKTVYTYNQDNQLLTETLPLVNSGIKYDGTTLESYVKRELAYDSLGRLKTETQIAYNTSNAEINRRVVVTNTYNNAGQLIKTLDAVQLASSRVGEEFSYDAYGNRVGSKDALGHVTVDEYDANNQLVKHSLIRSGTTGEYTGSQLSPTRITLATYQYDQAGRKYAEGDAIGSLQYYKFDERSNIIRDKSRAGGVKGYEYDELGHKTAETEVTTSSFNSNPDPYGAPVWVVSEYSADLHRWSYKNTANTDFVDYKTDLAQKHTVSGNAALAYTYAYNGFGQMKTETLSNNTVTYDYWENGLLKSITDVQGIESDGITNTSSYIYGRRGNRIVEKNSTLINKPGATYSTPYGNVVVPASSSNSSTTTFMSYDIRNRLIQAASPTGNVSISGSNYATTDLTSMVYSYDEWGNRRRVNATYTVPGQAAQTKTEWYSYDAADHVLVEAGISTGTTAAAFKNTNGVQQGVAYKYDNAGRRVKQETWDRTNMDAPAPYGTGLPLSEAYSTLTYSYNDLGLVNNVTSRSDTRSIGANSTAGYLSIGAETNTESSLFDNRGFKTSSTDWLNDKNSTYVYNVDGTLKTRSTFVKSNGRKESIVENNYDNSSNLTSYQVNNFDTSNSTNKQLYYSTYQYSYTATYSGRQVSVINVTSSQKGTASGITTNTYDTRGRMVASSITEGDSGNTVGTGYRRYAYNASGQIVAKAEQKYGTSGYKVQNYYYNGTGSELANLGALGQDVSPLSTVYAGGNTPGNYVVNSGDTLSSIAQSLFGDGNLWYIIADANGLHKGPTDAFGGDDVGRNLRIPNGDTSVRNTGSNFKPYNSGDIIGDLSPSPTLLPPPKQKGCNAIASIIMVVVAVVVTVYTAGAAAAYFAPAGSAVATAGASFGAGMAALGGGSIAGSIVGGFVGSVASQLVGKAMGVVDHFSLRQAVGSGLTAGFSAGAGAYINGMSAGGMVTKAATINQATGVVTKAAQLNIAGNMVRGAAMYLGAYASNKVAGLETHFSWTDMAVASVSSGITGKTGKGIDDALGGIGEGFAANLANNFWGSTVNSSLNRLAHGGGSLKSNDWGRMAADAFGNALASKVVELASAPPKLSEAEALAKKLVRNKLDKALSNQIDAFEKVGLGGEGSIGENVVANGQNLELLKEGVTGTDMEADRNTIFDNHNRQIQDVKQMANDAGLDEAQTTMLVSAFVLARYDALNKANPDFMWTQLGIFAANTVRVGLAQSYDIANALESTSTEMFASSLLQSSLVGGRLKEFADVSRGMARDTLQGQVNVLGDVGTLAIMHQTYGAEALSTARFTGMTDFSRESFRLQAGAEAARASGDMNIFHSMQTEAAIVMGMHEQQNLQTMWDKPLMKGFAKFNGAILEYTGRAIVHPDIYIGTNPNTAGDSGVYITAPKGAEDISIFENRVSIARNGFERIDSMQKTGGGIDLIESNQYKLGHSLGLVQPKIPSWKTSL